MALLRTLALVSALGPGNPTADCEGVPATKAARAVANDNRVASATDTARGSGRFRPDLGATDDGQLVGALIVDPEGRSPAIASSSSPTPASYRILARGMASAYDSVLSASLQETVVSGFMAPNRTMTMEWVPEKEAGQLALPLPLPGAHVGGAARRSSVRPGDRRVERCTQRSRRRCHGGTDRRDRGAPG